MRALPLLVLVLGCERAPPAEPPPPVPRNAPVAPGAPMNAALPDEVRVRLDLDLARAAIRAHQQQSSAWPASLDQLGLKLHFPADLRYDPATGEVGSATYPRL